MMRSLLLGALLVSPTLHNGIRFLRPCGRAVLFPVRSRQSRFQWPSFDTLGASAERHCFGSAGLDSTLEARWQRTTTRA